MAAKATGKVDCERPVFAHHSGDVKSLLTLVQDGYQRKNVAKESLVGSQSMGYTSMAVPIDEIFSKLRLIEAHELHQGTGAESERMAHIFAQRAEQAKCVAMEDVLSMASGPGHEEREPNRQTSRVLVLGGAGSGKTMSFARKAALDWSYGKIWPHIELLFVLPLQRESVHMAENLDDLIDLVRLGITVSSKVGEICDYIGDHWERVCFLFDGLDEVQFDKCSGYVQGIIRGEAMTQAHVVVTSRPSNGALILDRDYPFKTRLELMGFDREEMAEYVRRVLKNEHAADFLRQVNACPQLAALLQSPLHCVNACAVYRAGTEKLPTTLPAMTTAIMDAVVQHAQSKFRNADPVSTDWSKVDAELKASANAVTSFAFTALSEKTTVFQNEHFKRLELSLDGRDLGLLVNCDDLACTETPQWKFAHLNMQEALAARFVSSGNTPEEIAWLVGELGALTGHLNTFWRCLAAELDMLSADALIRAILAQPDSPTTTTSTSSTSTMESGQLHNATQHQSTASASQHSHRPKLSEVLNPSHDQLRQLADDLSTHLPGEQIDRLAVHLLSSLVKGDAPAAVHSVMPPSSYSTLAFLQQLLLHWKVLSPRSSLLALHRAVAKLNQTAATTCFPFLVSEIASQPQARPMADLRSAEGKQRLLLAIRCYQEFSSATTTKPIVPSLKKALMKSGLNLGDIRLTTSDSAAVGLVLEVFNSVITVLDITKCYIGDAGFQQLSDGVSTCTGLQVLYMDGNALSDEHIASISMIIKKNHGTLLSLTTDANSFSSDGNAVMHQHTHQCKQLQLVRVGGPKVVTCDVNKAVLWSILANCNDLQGLHLTHFSMTNDTHVQLLCTLATMNITQLSLQYTGMSVQSTAAVNTFLQQRQEHLTVLHLTGNNLSDDFVSRVYNALARCSRLERLDLYVNKLTSVCLSVLASLVRQLPCLATLWLQNNDFRAEDDGAAAFADVVERHPALRDLRMPELVSTQLQAMLTNGSAVVYQDVVPWEEWLELHKTTEFTGLEDVFSDPWQRLEFRSCYHRLVHSMKPLDVRMHCYNAALISSREMEELVRLDDDQLRHNKRLLQMLEVGGAAAFLHFRTVLHKIVSLPVRTAVEELDKMDVTFSPQDKEVYFPAEGGEFELHGGVIQVSAPAGAVDTDGGRFKVQMSETKGEVRQFEGHPVYLSQAFKFTSQPSGSYQRPIRVTVNIPDMPISKGKVLVFRSDTKGSTPDFQDITDECSPQFADGAVHFAMTRFCLVGFCVSLARLSLEVARSWISPRTVRLVVAAKTVLNPTAKEVPMMLFIDPASSSRDDERQPMTGYNLVTQAELRMTYYQKSVSIQLETYDGRKPAPPSSCGTGGHWFLQEEDKLNSWHAVNRVSVEWDSEKIFRLRRHCSSPDPAAPPGCDWVTLAQGFFRCEVQQVDRRFPDPNPISAHFEVTTDSVAPASNHSLEATSMSASQDQADPPPSTVPGQHTTLSSGSQALCQALLQALLQATAVSASTQTCSQATTSSATGQVQGGSGRGEKDRRVTEAEKKTLQSLLVDFTETVTPEALCDYLCAVRIITDDLRKHLADKSIVPKDRAHDLHQALMRGGARAFDRLIGALLKSRLLAHEELADKLKGKLEEVLAET